MSDQNPSQQLIICIGLPRSGSTWALNIARGILLEHHKIVQPRTIYADELDENVDVLLTATVPVLLKSHMPGASLRLLGRVARTKGFVTLRCPYDCIASLMERFRFSFSDALLAIFRSCTTISHLLNSANYLVLRYEDKFIENRDVIAEIAAILELDVDRELEDRLMTDHSASAVRSRLARLRQEGVFVGENPVNEIEPETHWHYNHLGEQEMVSAQGYLTPEQLAVAGHALRHLLPPLGYEVIDVGPSVDHGTRVSFNDSGLGGACLRAGFGLIESWGVWIVEDLATIELRLAGSKTGMSELVLHCRLGPALTLRSGGASCALYVNDVRKLTIMSAEDNSEYPTLSVPIDMLAQDDRIHLKFINRNVRSPADLAVGEDTRAISLGLIEFVFS